MRNRIFKRPVYLEGAAEWADKPFSLPVASEREVLDFANKVRVAGGGETITALLPSLPSKPDSCLIARALNFECCVEGIKATGGDEEAEDWEGSWTWGMFFSNEETRDKVAAALALEKCAQDCYVWGYKHSPGVILPAHIGNAADAFDEGIAFGKYKESEL